MSTKFVFYTMFNAKAVDCQGWIFTAHPKGEASKKTSHAVFIVGSSHSSIRETLCFSIVIQGHIQQESCSKNYWILAGLLYSINHINQNSYQVIAIFFVLYKMLSMTKNFSEEDQVKIIKENYLLDIGMMVRVLANGLRDLSSIPGRVIHILLNTQQ